MLITVGSKNPNKIQAVREAFLLFPRFSVTDIKSINVESGVSAQPTGLEEIITGAHTRALNSFTGCSLSTGLESGIIPVPGIRSGFMNTTVCVIYDGEKHYTGLGPAFELPEKIVNHVIDEGIELDEAIFKSGFSTNKRIGYSEGIIGILTEGVITRKNYMIPAVTMAISAYLTDMNRLCVT